MLLCRALTLQYLTSCYPPRELYMSGLTQVTRLKAWPLPSNDALSGLPNLRDATIAIMPDKFHTGPLVIHESATLTHLRLNGVGLSSRCIVYDAVRTYDCVSLLRRFAGVGSRQGGRGVCVCVCEEGVEGVWHGAM